MAAVQKGLGRGLGALFQDDVPFRAEVTPEEQAGVRTMPVGEIHPNPHQPRKDFDQEALNELAASIREQGLIQPILVRPVEGGAGGHEIVAGERRWRASQLAGLTEVQVVVRELSEQQALALALIENLQREDLNPLEEAWGMQRLREEFGLSQDELARQLGKSRSAVANCLRLLNLSENAQQDLRLGRISAGHARALLSFEDLEERENIRKRIVAEKLSVREVEALAFAAKEEPAAVQTGQTSPAEPAGLAAGAEHSQAPEAASLPVKTKKPRSAVLMELQTRISRALQLPVKISGQEDSGRLSIKFSSSEELDALLAKLGLGES